MSLFQEFIRTSYMVYHNRVSPRKGMPSQDWCRWFLTKALDEKNSRSTERKAYGMDQLVETVKRFRLWHVRCTYVELRATRGSPEITKPREPFAAHGAPITAASPFPHVGKHSVCISSRAPDIRSDSGSTKTLGVPAECVRWQHRRAPSAFQCEYRFTTVG